MSKRTEILAKRLEQGIDQLASYAESLTMQEWVTSIPQEGRSAGVVIHHVASMFPIEMGVAQTIANGQAVTGVNWDLVAEINANHAIEHAQPERAATLTLLRQNSAAAADAIRALTDEQLEMTQPISLYGDAPLTLQFWLEDHQITHSYRHLANIKKTVDALQLNVVR